MGDRVYEGIYAAILDHRLPPGTRLPEESVGEIFGVSRTIVRRALARLAHKNIVEIRPNRSAIVAKPSVKEAYDVFLARQLIERETTRLAARNINSDQISKLRSLVEEERTAFERADRRTWIRLSGAYHIEVAEISGNTVLVEFLQTLVSRTSLIIALYERAGHSVCSFDEHQAITDALEAGDEDRAASLMAAHLEDCEANLSLAEEDNEVDLKQALGPHADLPAVSDSLDLV